MSSLPSSSRPLKRSADACDGDAPAGRSEAAAEPPKVRRRGKNRTGSYVVTNLTRISSTSSTSRYPLPAWSTVPEGQSVVHPRPAFAFPAPRLAPSPDPIPLTSTSPLLAVPQLPPPPPPAPRPAARRANNRIVSVRRSSVIPPLQAPLRSSPAPERRHSVPVFTIPDEELGELKDGGEVVYREIAHRYTPALWLSPVPAHLQFPSGDVATVPFGDMPWSAYPPSAPFFTDPFQSVGQYPPPQPYQYHQPDQPPPATPIFAFEAPPLPSFDPHPCPAPIWPPPLPHHPPPPPLMRARHSMAHHNPINHALPSLSVPPVERRWSSPHITTPTLPHPLPVPRDHGRGSTDQPAASRPSQSHHYPPCPLPPTQPAVPPLPTSFPTSVFWDTHANTSSSSTYPTITPYLAPDSITTPPRTSPGGTERVSPTEQALGLDPSAFGPVAVEWDPAKLFRPTRMADVDPFVRAFGLPFDPDPIGPSELPSDKAKSSSPPIPLSTLPTSNDDAMSYPPLIDKSTTTRLRTSPTGSKAVSSSEQALGLDPRAFGQIAVELDPAKLLRPTQIAGVPSARAIPPVPPWDFEAYQSIAQPRQSTRHDYGKYGMSAPSGQPHPPPPSSSSRPPTSTQPYITHDSHPDPYAQFFDPSFRPSHQ